MSALSVRIRALLFLIFFMANSLSKFGNRLPVASYSILEICSKKPLLSALGNFGGVQLALDKKNDEYKTQMELKTRKRVIP